MDDQAIANVLFFLVAVEAAGYVLSAFAVLISSHLLLWEFVARFPKDAATHNPYYNVAWAHPKKFSFFSRKNQRRA